MHRVTRKFLNYFYNLPSKKINNYTEDKPFDLIEEQRNMPPRPDIGVLHDDISPALAILRDINPSLVLEVGTGRGNLTANICKFTSANVVTINALPEQISGNLTTFALSRDEIGQVYREYGYSDRVTQIFANTFDFNLKSALHDQTIDLAIIDACHDTDFVLNDFHLVKAVLGKDGIVLLHDTHPSRYGHLAGSYDACIMLRAMGYDIRHLTGTWWGFWRNGEYTRLGRFFRGP